MQVKDCICVNDSTVPHTIEGLCLYQSGLLLGQQGKWLWGHLELTEAYDGKKFRRAVWNTHGSAFSSQSRALAEGSLGCHVASSKF
jgi:hypothetical protein